jgi:hypothetical protein
LIALPASPVTPVDPIDPNDGPLPVDEVAIRLAQALEAVESVPTAPGDSRRDPIGWVIAVNFSVDGLKNVPLLLTWSLDGVDVPASWAVDNVAYRVTATTAHDGGSVEVWVPDLSSSGAYNVNIKLAREADGTVMGAGKPLRLPGT